MESRFSTYHPVKKFAGAYVNKLILLIICLVPGIQMSAQSEWEISTAEKENYVPTCVANGRIGIVPDVYPFKTTQVVMNHVFDRESKHGISKVLQGINPFNVAMAIDGDTITLEDCRNWSQTLHMKEAVFHTSFELEKKANVHYSIRALRHMPYCGLMNFTIKAQQTIEIEIGNTIHTPNEYKEVQSTFRMFRDLDARMPVFQATGLSPFGAHQLSAASGFIFQGKMPEIKDSVENSYESSQNFTIRLKKGETYSFALVGAVCSSRDFNDPYGESERFVVFAQREGDQKLIQNHTKAWKQLWQSDIIIDGDRESQQDVRFALYNLYSYQRADSDLSPSPMGLSSIGYNGHVFWDSEIWMLPPLLLMQPKMAESMLNYRINRLPQAIERAKNYGYKGAMYPWESDDSGEEATPTWCLTGTLEHHITADVGIAMWNYYCLNQNKQWLKSKGWPVISEVANFWVSRATENSDGSFSIVNVVGANEYAHGVTDNAFTNGAAITCLMNAVEAAKILNHTYPQQWLNVANKLRILQFKNGVTREHASYNGEVIKQADVNLLAYPLNIISDSVAVKKDLEYYAPKFDANGPAMAFSIQSILYARLGEADKAFEMFKRSYLPNERVPFGVLAESVNSNNPYFATGAGGMLQAVLFGFAGLEITNRGLKKGKGCLPKPWDELIISGFGIENKKVTIVKN